MREAVYLLAPFRFCRITRKLLGILGTNLVHWNEIFKFSKNVKVADVHLFLTFFSLACNAKKVCNSLSFLFSFCPSRRYFWTDCRCFFWPRSDVFPWTHWQIFRRWCLLLLETHDSWRAICFRNISNGGIKWACKYYHCF